jgi:broad specificity phosphatase PhoE
VATTVHLVRHGPSSHSAGSGWVDAAGFQHWRDRYDAAGIDLGSAVPRTVIDVVNRADVLVASDLRRARESARRLAPLKPIVHSHLFREIPLPIPTWVPVRLPVAAWDGLAHVEWGYRILRNADVSPADLDRVNDAIAWLERLEGDPETISVITHGVFRRLLANRLSQLGWEALSPRRSYRCWSLWSFVKRSGE